MARITSSALTAMTIHPLNGPRDATMTAITWQQALDSAHTSQKVVRLAREFVATFSPLEIELLPAGCRPSAKIFEEDIAAYAFDLVRYEMDHGDLPELLHKLARFFSHAATRLGQINVCEPGNLDISGRESA
jgi:hypothetical protein